MPAISFVYPEMLWLLTLVGGLWALALATPRRLPPARFYTSLALRTGITVSLALAVAGAQLMIPVRQLTVVFLLDDSDSISASAHAQAETFIQEALTAMPEGDRAAIVVFGGDALVERVPSADARLARIIAAPVSTRTNIDEAIQLGMALFPADALKRLVLLSDGGENDGQAIKAARQAAVSGVPIEVVSLAAPAGREVLVSSLGAPTSARNGQEITLDAQISSSVEQDATVRLLGDAGQLAVQRTHLVAGESHLAFQVKAVGSGFQRYRVQVEAAGDAQPQNNQAAAIVEVQGPPRVLVVADNRNESAALIAALGAAGMIIEEIAPAAMPADLIGLSSYEEVILVNVPARALPVGAMAALPVYVRDLGRGLLMIGGDASFGVGGYGRTPVEEALPVYMDVRDREERPDLAIVFVIDKSGSMDSCHCSSSDRRAPITGLGGYVRKVDIAKEAVAQAAALLSERDTIGVVTFDRRAENVLPATRGATLDQVVASLRDVQPNGSTNVRSGLLSAEEMLAGVDARIKHMILVTDGWGSGGSSIDLAQRFAQEGITLSVVAAGGGSATYLEDLARDGGGRFYASNGRDDLPQIFVQETITTVGNYIVERPFTPVAVGDHPVLTGIAGLPGLYGFNASTIKESARRVLMTDDGQPILATWQYGLGRSAAWLSDTKSKWAKDWLSWAGFPRFAGQLASWALPARGGTSTTAEVSVANGTATVRLALGQGAPQLAGTPVVTATLIGGDSARQELALPQAGPDAFQGSIPSPQPGTYIVQVTGVLGGRVLLHQTVSMVVPYSAEYGTTQSDPALLGEIAGLTGGTALSSGADAFSPPPGFALRAEELGLPLLLLALALLPLDILIRRIAVRVRRR